MVETMAYAGQLPWHGLGTRVSENISVDEMMVESGLDWEVQKVPAYADLNGTRIHSGHDMLVRTSDNTALDMVTGNWNPVQNAEAFDFFRDFVEAGDMEMHTAGSLQGGKRVWCLAKVKDDFTIGGKDLVESYLLLTNPHMYGRAVDIRFTPIRVVCNNTLTLSLGQKGDYQVSMSHKKAFNADEAKNLLGVAKDKMSQYEEMAKFLNVKRWTNDTVKAYFATVFPNTNPNAKNKTFPIAEFDKYASKNAKRALEVMPIQPGADMGAGSFWQAYNAVTYLTDHELGRSADSRLASAWYGLNKVKKVKALELAIEFAEAA
tara:strand:- start:703 stop:1659 length:957 start_codon:yes stop_codon:yes gene_type:complete